MRAQIARAQRGAAVRAAGRSWAGSGLIDAAAATAIPSLYPDDRVRVGRAARVLFFLFTALAASAFFGFVVLFLAGVVDGFVDGFVGVLAFGFGAALVALAEFLNGPMRRAESGSEEAAGLLGVGFLLLAAERLLSAGDWFTGPAGLASVAAALCALAAWRWGGTLYGAAGAAALFVALVGLPGARWVWLLAAAAMLLPLLHGTESVRLAPGQRRATAAAFWIAAIAGYAALHPVAAVDALSQQLGAIASEPAGENWQTWEGGAIVLVPLGLIVAGVRSRRRLLLDLGLILALLSAVWLSHEAGLGPAWLVLLVAGAVVVALVMLVRRYLNGGSAQERHGLTPEALWGESDTSTALEIAAVLATVSPGPRSGEPPPLPEVGAEGGEFGGGGASSRF